MKRRKTNWLIRLTLWVLRYGFIVIFWCVRLTGQMAVGIGEMGLKHLGIKEDEAPADTEFLKPRKIPELLPDEWKNLGKANRDGYIMQENRRTGAKRVIVQRTGQVMPISV